ncbi:MAG: DoxX family protein [Chloroflexi bacterium]|nr:MAG: DoxX family protein [Chloroflexota bacterium]
MLRRTFEQLEPYAPTILRVMFGIVFFLHGWAKLQNPAGFIGFVGSLGFPAPTIFGWVVILLEFIGGLLMIIGLFTRPVALAFAVEMLITTLVVKTGVGFIAPQGAGAGAELDLLLLAASTTLLILGAGELSVDENVLGRRRMAERRMT